MVEGGLGGWRRGEELVVARKEREAMAGKEGWIVISQGLGVEKTARFEPFI